MRGKDTTHSPAGKIRTISTGWHFNWQRMIRKVLGAPFRIHHYRDLHTRMLRDALCYRDCASAKDGDSTKLGA